MKSNAAHKTKGDIMKRCLESLRMNMALAGVLCFGILFFSGCATAPSSSLYCLKCRSLTEGDKFCSEKCREEWYKRPEGEQENSFHKE